MKNSNLLLRIITTYSIITSLVILVAFGKSILFSPSEMSNFLFDLSFFTIFLLLLISNIFLISSKQYLPKFLWYNIIVYFLQIIHLKFFGVIFDFSFGIEIMAGIVIHNVFTFELNFDLWKMIFQALYKTYDEGFVFVVSLVPLLLFLSYRKLLLKNKNEVRTNLDN